MGLYIYQHPKTKELKEVVQRMTEEHTYVDDKGVKWNRVFTKPQAAMDTQISAHDPKDFVKKTRGKNYTLGQLWDKSAELSDRRGGASGQDEVKQKAEQAYEKRTGKKHPHAKKSNSTIYI